MILPARVCWHTLTTNWLPAPLRTRHFQQVQSSLLNTNPWFQLIPMNKAVFSFVVFSRCGARKCVLVLFELFAVSNLIWIIPDLLYKKREKKRRNCATFSLQSPFPEVNDISQQKSCKTMRHHRSTNRQLFNGVLVSKKILSPAMDKITWNETALRPFKMIGLAKLRPPTKLHCFAIIIPEENDTSQQ